MKTQNQVTLKKSHLESNKLALTVIDSASNAAESVIDIPVLANGTLQIGGEKDKYCLAHNLCFFLIL